MRTKFLFGKPEGKRPLGRLRCKWKDHKEIRYEGVSWIHLSQDIDQ